MIRFLAVALTCCLASGTLLAKDEGRYDAILRHVIRSFDLRPLPTKPFERTPKFILGQALFFDPILSGNRDISCATCHLIDRGTSDALRRSIGTGGVGLAEHRTLPEGRPQQPRNALDLWNRDNNWVRAMFWDGRVEALDPVRRTFRSPLGDLLPAGLENLMSVQALFPLAQEDEMLGLPGDRSSTGLPGVHANQSNDLASETAGLEGPERIQRVHELIMERLLGIPGEPPEHWQTKYRELMAQAYPERPSSHFSIIDVANALSHFEEIAFATRATPWDAYVSGDQSAISETAKRGAFLFFGRGRCAVCHSGPLFSDFAFHSIGVKESAAEIDGLSPDLGRSLVTGQTSDGYKFRTPPLRNVTLTAPYFHNGCAPTLEAAIMRHIDPLIYADRYEASGHFAMSVEQIRAISPVLIGKLSLSEDDVSAILAFLHTLEDGHAKNLVDVVPETVPSGLPVSRP